MKILVTGTTGYVGGQLSPALRELGHDMICPGRNGAHPVSLENPESYRAHLEGVDALIHLAAHNPRPWQRGATDRERFMRLNAVSSGIFAKLAAEAGVKTFILASSARVYGRGKSPFSEHSPMLATDPYGASKIAAETAVTSALFSTTCIPVLLRMPMVTGKPGGWVSLGARLRKAGLSLPAPIMGARRTVLQIETLARVVDAALHDPQAFSGALNIGENEVRTIGELAGYSGAEKSASQSDRTRLLRLAENFPFMGEAISHAAQDCVLDLSRMNAVMQNS